MLWLFGSLNVGCGANIYASWYGSHEGRLGFRRVLHASYKGLWVQYRSLQRLVTGVIGPYDGPVRALAVVCSKCMRTLADFAGESPFLEGLAI